MHAAEVVSVTAAAVHSMWSATRAIQQLGQQTNNVLPVRRPRMMVCVARCWCCCWLVHDKGLWAVCAFLYSSQAGVRMPTGLHSSCCVHACI